MGQGDRSLVPIQLLSQICQGVPQNALAINFENVDISAGNKAYSNGLILYSEFLEEYDGTAKKEVKVSRALYSVVRTTG